MKKLVVLAVASLIATSANAAEMKWNGDVNWRFSSTKIVDGLNSKHTVMGLAGVNAAKDVSETITKAHQISASLGATGGWENIEWGIGVRTQSRGIGSANSVTPMAGVTVPAEEAANAKNSSYTTVNSADLGIALSQAWFRYTRDMGSLDFNVTVGRQKNVFAYDTFTQNFFDNDVNFDGLGWQFKFGMFGFNMSQYVLGAKNGGAQGGSTHVKTEASETVASGMSSFNALYGFQPHMNWKFSDEVEAMFAIGYYSWDYEATANRAGMPANWTNNNALNTGNAIQGNDFKVHNPRQWQFLTTWKLPYKLAGSFELVMNKKQVYDDISTTPVVPNVAYYVGTRRPDAGRTAWAAGLKYGQLGRAHDFTIGYSYSNKGLASVINAYTNDKVQADNIGHQIKAGYSVADNFNLGVAVNFLKEKNQLNPSNGLPYAGQQERRTTYMEANAGVLF